MTPEERAAHCRRIGILGGEAIKASKPWGYYQTIGAKGGNALVEKHGAEHMVAIGKRGGAKSRRTR